jgi:hypothetical protein
MPTNTTGHPAAPRRHGTSPQILTLELEGITAGDYLSWCRDPDPPALGSALRSISIHADPLGDTITALLDWDREAPAPAEAAQEAGLLLSPEVRVRPANDLLTGGHATPDISAQPPRARKRRASSAPSRGRFSPREAQRRLSNESAAFAGSPPGRSGCQCSLPDELGASKASA